jgi:hypothetical protein
VGSAVEAQRTLPSSTQSFQFEGPRLRLFLDAEGVKRATPPLFTGNA